MITPGKYLVFLPTVWYNIAMFKAINKSFRNGDFSHISENMRWYIAGFLDGEGYFGLLKVNQTTPRKGQTSSFYYYPVVKVLNTNKEIMDILQSLLGGYYFLRSFKNNKWKDAHSLEFKSGKRILPLLKWLYPCLIVKKPVCGILIEFLEWQYEQDSIRTHRSQAKGLRGYNEDEQKKKEEYYQKCKTFTARGTAVTTK